MNARGFTLVEVLVVVVVAGIIAAVALPAALRGQIEANEARTIGDLHTVANAQAAYASVNKNYFDAKLLCLYAPAQCIPNYPPGAPGFLEYGLASLQPRSGYNRALHVGLPVPPQPAISPSSVSGYVYLATPLSQGSTGVRGFGVDGTGRYCFTPDGTAPPEGAPGMLDPGCKPLP